jgi:hypothetical protein
MSAKQKELSLQTQKYQVLEGMEQKYLVMMVCRLKGVSSDDGM